MTQSAALARCPVNELTAHRSRGSCVHSPSQTSRARAIHRTTWIPPHMHMYTHRPWLATSSPQVTDVCVWGDDSNEYWVTGVMSLPFCLIMPPTLTLQPITRVSKPSPSFSFGPSGTPVSSSRKDFLIISSSPLRKWLLLLDWKHFSVTLAEVVPPVAVKNKDWYVTPTCCFTIAIKLVRCVHSWSVKRLQNV